MLLNQAVTKENIGSVVNITGLIASVTEKMSSTNKPYLDISLKDISGKIESVKYFGVTEQHSKEITAGRVLTAKGLTVTEFNDKPQVTLNNKTEVTVEDFNPAIHTDLLVVAPYSEKLLANGIKRIISTIKDPIVKGIAVRAYKEKEHDLLNFPAARSHHHAYRSGLSFHTLDMLNMAYSLCVAKPYLNRDIVLAAVLLHDIEKTTEFSVSTAYDVKSYSLEGTLIGHIPLTLVLIDRLCDEMDSESTEEVTTPSKSSQIVLYLKHAVLAHHGKLEWGSPVTPSTPEAVAVHQLDMLDANVQSMYDKTKTQVVGEVVFVRGETSVNSGLSYEVHDLYSSEYLKRMYKDLKELFEPAQQGATEPNTK